MMKRLTIGLLTFFMTANLLKAQNNDGDNKDLYPVIYSFEKAEEFQTNGEYEKAIWFYINLFPENKEKVVELVKSLSVKLDTVDMAKFIKASFALYGTFDPSITSFENGAPNMNIEKLLQKGAWGDELIRKISDSDKPLSSASEYNFRGLDKTKSGEFSGAIEDFNKAIEIKPSGQIYFNRAYSKTMIKDFEGAVNDFDKAIEFEYRLAEAYFERGYCKDQLNNLEGAVNDYTKAIEVDGDYADAYNNRAYSKMKQNDFKAAIKDFDKALKINPLFIAAYMNRGFAKKEDGDQSGACKDWEKAVELGYKQAQQIIAKNCK